MPQNRPFTLQQPISPPDWFWQAVQRCAPNLTNTCHAAELLWRRGIQDPEKLPGFLNADLYKPASSFEFGEEMRQAVERIQQARKTGEFVTIWGDFDADGVTSTAVLRDGFGQFFPAAKLSYYIPDRLVESHGLNCRGLEAIARTGTQLIVTCDTGSTNLKEIEYANSLGIDIIITDHHALLDERPPVTAIINPRYLPKEHPLFHLSGVAVAYKLIEALYEVMPDVPARPLEELLDLVAIGLIADLVQLSGDCRYLAQLGIKRLQADFQQPPPLRRRPGVGRLLELCQKNGDRPTDISFGLGPRINAISRIHGDASFGVELLTGRDIQHCLELAEAAELANGRRKALQKDVAADVAKKLAQLDLSTTDVIVLDDPQWHLGVLGLVAAEVAQNYGRPTILLSTDNIARGSARSVANIDLYELVKSQEHLLDRFGGHPFAAGLSLPVENLPLFTEAINQQLKTRSTAFTELPAIQADLTVTVAELGQDLFRELKLLEPCGIGNPVPKLLIQNCWFENTWNKNIQDFKGRKIRYIKTEFTICDSSDDLGFNGVWWGYYKEDIPSGRCDAVVELDYNTYAARYEVRLIAVRPCFAVSEINTHSTSLQILDWRSDGGNADSQLLNPEELSSLKIIKDCPTTWDDLQVSFQQAIRQNQSVAIAFPPPEAIAPHQLLQQLIGIAKYLSRTGRIAKQQQLQDQLRLSKFSVNLGLKTLSYLGFYITPIDSESYEFKLTSHSLKNDTNSSNLDPETSLAINKFIAAIEEEQFRHDYFYKTPLSILQVTANQIAEI